MANYCAVLSRLMVLTFLLSGISARSMAAIDAYEFPNAEMRERHNTLIAELRCPQCLNTNIAGSDSMISRDLRREVHRLLIEGKSDEEILDFMQARYGDFILYDPPFKMSTLFLWLGPLAFFMVGLFVLMRFIRKDSAAGSELSEEDRKKLEQLLTK